MLIDFDSSFGPDQYNSTGIDTTLGRLFWADNEQLVIYTSLLDGSSAEVLLDVGTIFPSDHRLWGVAASDSHVFWTDTREEAIFSARLDGSAPSKLIDLASAFGFADYGPVGIELSGSKIWWVDVHLGRIYTASIDGTNPELLIDLKLELGLGDDLEVWDIAVSDSGLFWGDQNTGAIYRSDLDGRNVSVLIDLVDVFGGQAGDYAQVGIEVDEEWVYWNDFRKRAIYRARIDGTSPVKLFDNLSSWARYLTVAETGAPTSERFEITNIRFTYEGALTRLLEITWKSRIGARYQLQVSKNMEQWVPVDDGIITASWPRTDMEVSIPTSWTRAYVRVVEL